MDIKLSASGTPAQVTTDLAAQLKNARDGNEGAWPALATLRDYVSAEIAKQDGETVSVEVVVTVTVTAGDERRAPRSKSRSGSAHTIDAGALSTEL